MLEENQNPTPISEPPPPKTPLTVGKPLIIGLAAVLAVVALANVSSLVSGHKKEPPRSALPFNPAVANPRQVNQFQVQQDLQTKSDADDKARQALLTAQLERLKAEESVPGPESDAAAPMTAAQRQALYGANNPNAPKKTSGVSEAQAQAKQRALAREKQHQDAINSDTVAIDFPSSGAGRATPQDGDSSRATLRQAKGTPTSSPEIAGDSPPEPPATDAPSASGNSTQDSKKNAMGAYPFDAYQGRLYRVFEGTVFEGVVTNHIDGGLNGPILIMLTTDYYSHDHQQLLMPQGTRLIGTVQATGNGQARKLFVVFHRAVCPDGFSVDLDKFIGLDPIGTTGLASKVDHGYFTAFAAAAAIGGIGGLAQIGNTGNILDSSNQIRNGITAQSSQEAEQVLNHFLNRLPIITLKEGSRARVYIGRDIEIPSYAEHSIDPTAL